MIGGLLEITISFILSNLVGVALVLAAICSVISLWRRGVAADRVAVAETFLSYILLLVIGITGLQAFIMHTFFPEFTSAFIGWKPSPFEFEVAVADLSQGVLGVLAFSASRGFRLATVIAVVIMSTFRPALCTAFIARGRSCSTRSGKT